MTSVEIIILLSAILLLAYTYLLYPLIIMLISYFFKDEDSKSDYFPTISILISAFNEENVIKERIENISGLDYDFNKVEVLVGSDCSSDNTNNLLEDLKKKYSWLSVYLFNQRRGKASVLNDLARNAQNDIFIFTDANSVFNQDIIQLLSSHFYNPQVGGVSGRLVLSEPKANFDKSIEEKKYWEYETFIKKYEGKCGVLIGANGGIFAIRGTLFNNIPVENAVTDDLYITLNVLKQGYKFLYDYNAVAFEEVAHEIIHEYKRKTRFTATNFQTLVYFAKLLFYKNLLLSFALWSHKIIRWITPILFSIIIIINFFLYSESIIFKILLCFQLTAYAIALSGYLLSKLNIKIKFFTIPFYFVLTNIAMMEGMFKFVFRKHTAYWQSTPRN